MNRTRSLVPALLLAAGVLFAGPGSLNGFIRDAASGEPLAYANVFLDGTDLGAASNDRGYYYIGGVPAGDYRLVASYVGYGTLRQPVSVAAGAGTTLDLALRPGAVEVDEVVVSAERAVFEREVELSATRLDTRQLAAMPKVGGELDLLRVVQLLPGVIATSDFSNKLYIRGGSPDQNLILLDGITVYNPSHLFGLYSPFVPEAVSDVTLLAGGFPARYGGRLSSVLDITTREGNSKHYTGLGSLSLLAAKAVAEGPIPGGSFLVAGRRTWLPDALLETFDVEGLGYYFYDLMGKVNHEVGRGFRATLAGLAAEDVLTFWDPDDPDALDARLAWGNRGLSGRADLILSPLLYGEVQGAVSNFSSGFRVAFEESDTARMTTDLTDLLLASDFTWYVADDHTVSFGVNLKRATMDMSASFGEISFEQGRGLWPLAAYLDDQWDLLPDRLFIKPGLRCSFYSNDTRFEPEPRLGLKYRVGENTALNAAAGRYTQPLVTLNSTDALFSIYDIWVPIPDGRPTPAALHFVAGAEHWLRRDLTFKAEAWYKDYADLLEARYGEFATPPESLLAADGYSGGLDLMLRRTGGLLDGWVGYSYMWTRRSIGAEAYHPHYDRRHNLSVVASFPALFWGTDLSVRFNLGTGLPYAGTVGYYHRYEYRPDVDETRYWWGFIDGPRDAFRYPVYHRLDAGLTKKWQTGWGTISAFLDVTNLYNSRNVLLYYWEVEDGAVPVRKSIPMIPILPTLGVEVRF